MYSKFQLAKKYLQYQLHAANGKGHGVHSPFVYAFIRNILKDKKIYACYAQIETLRHSLLHDERLLEIEDFGAGSRVNATNQRKVSAVANSALKSKKYGRLLFRMSHHFKPENVLELGTCLGITTAYLANGNNKAEVITMEGARQIARIAENNFEKLGLRNIDLIRGNFDETLPKLVEQFLSEGKTLDFAFIDGNHRKEPTIRYFEELLPVLGDHSILVFDDIHWSEEMEMAWTYIQQQQRVTLTIDLFFVGVVFFRKENKVNQHFAIRF